MLRQPTKQAVLGGGGPPGIIAAFLVQSRNVRATVDSAHFPLRASGRHLFATDAAQAKQGGHDIAQITLDSRPQEHAIQIILDALLRWEAWL